MGNIIVATFYVELISINGDRKSHYDNSKYLRSPHSVFGMQNANIETYMVHKSYTSF